MRMLFSLVYIPVLFTITTACAPKRYQPAAQLKRTLVNRTPEVETSDAPTTGPIVAQTETSPEATGPHAPAVDVAQVTARITKAKTLLWSKFYLPFDEETAIFPVGIRTWVYTDAEKAEIVSHLTAIVADAATLLDVTVDQSVVDTHARGLKILKAFTPAPKGE